MKKSTRKIILILAAFLGFIIVAIFAGTNRETGGYINMHEHMQGLDNVEVYLDSIEPLGFEKTILLGSPRVTLFQRGGFEDYDDNNDELLKIHEKYPEKFEVLCTTYWYDEEQVEKAEECWKRGAKGIKLYNGHGSFYDLPLDHENMLPLYEFIQEKGLILLIHVNGNKYLDEFAHVLEMYPDMKVICPHFCLMSKKLSQLEILMEEFPNLYTDMSFGYIEYTAAGFKRFSKSVEKFRPFVELYQDRIFFGTDQVITDVKTKNHPEFLEEVFSAYMEILTEPQFKFETTWPMSYDETYEGLQLDEDTLQTILKDSPQKLLDSVPEYELPEVPAEAPEA